MASTNKRDNRKRSMLKQCLFVLACFSFLFCWGVYGKLLNKPVQASYVAVFINGSSVTLEGEVEKDILESLADNRQFIDLLDNQLREEGVHEREEDYDRDVHELMGNPISPRKRISFANTAATSSSPAGSSFHTSSHSNVKANASTSNLTSSSSDQSRSHCSRSDKVKALICSVSLKPEGRWLEPFRSENRRMSVLYPLETPSIRIEAQACSCGKKVHIGTANGAVTSLVVRAGQSTVALFVTDDSHSKQWVYSKYYLKLYRNASLPSPEEAFAPQAKYNICRLYQDCDIHLHAFRPCGLVSEQSPTVSWELYVQRLHQKSLCDNAHHEGYWAVPCKSCHNRESCFWTQAKWITNECRYSTYDNVTKLRSKLEGKTLLFFGDSTLRGMMYHLIQKVNGSLEEWSVVHDHKMFKNVNYGKTEVIFMYYPQFFLPVNGPRNNLSSLLHDFGKFKDSTDTVLMVGGVQWMNVQFLDHVKSELNRAGLSGIKVIIKGYGAGFNVPEAGILFRTLEEQQMVAERNGFLMHRSLDLGYKFIDTFWMTSSRYKQQLHGACACHFHDIVHHPGSYSVVGPINAAYSDILLQLLTI